MQSLLIVTAVMYSFWIAANWIYAQRTHWVQIKEQLVLLAIFMGAVGGLTTLSLIASRQEKMPFESIDLTNPFVFLAAMALMGVGYYAWLTYNIVCGEQLFGRTVDHVSSHSTHPFSAMEFVRNCPRNWFAAAISLFWALSRCILFYMIVSKLKQLGG